VANHAKAIVACDFLSVFTATFRCLYVFVTLEIETRELLHIDVTDQPMAAWTLQPLREAIPSDHPYQYLIHDRDRIFSADLDESIGKLGLRALKRPYRSPLTQLLLWAVHWDPQARMSGFSNPLGSKVNIPHIVCEIVHSENHTIALALRILREGRLW